MLEVRLAGFTLRKPQQDVICGRGFPLTKKYSIASYRLIRAHATAPYAAYIKTGSEAISKGPAKPVEQRTQHNEELHHFSTGIFSLYILQKHFGKQFISMLCYALIGPYILV